MIEAPFPQEEYESRHQQIQRLMERDGLDVVVASARDNFWYFTGLVSYQFDHLMRPEICFIPREGKPFALVYGNNKTKAEALPWFGRGAQLRGRALSAGDAERVPDRHGLRFRQGGVRAG